MGYQLEVAERCCICKDEGTQTASVHLAIRRQYVAKAVRYRSGDWRACGHECVHDSIGVDAFADTKFKEDVSDRCLSAGDGTCQTENVRRFLRTVSSH
jgi:hypothetical protein